MFVSLAVSNVYQYLTVKQWDTQYEKIRFKYVKGCIVYQGNQLLITWLGSVTVHICLVKRLCRDLSDSDYFGERASIMATASQFGEGEAGVALSRL